MGYLNKATITVDAILTNRGRELLAEAGSGGFQITQFAVADDEIDYSLYNPNHPEGDTYAGNVIENMPLMEATPDESQIMRFKLVTLTDADPKTTDGVFIIPQIIGFTNDSATTLVGNSPASGTPSTSTGLAEGYVLFVANARLLNIYVLPGNTTVNATTTPSNTATAINANGSITLDVPTGQRITFSKLGTKTGKTTATLFGKRSGATKTINIEVTPPTT
jgi:hypothetical protein